MFLVILTNISTGLVKKSFMQGTCTVSSIVSHLVTKVLLVPHFDKWINNFTLYTATNLYAIINGLRIEEHILAYVFIADNGVRVQGEVIRQEEKQKEEMKARLEQMTPEQLAKVQELVSLMTGGKTDAGSGSSQARTQSSSSDRVGSMQEPYQTEKSSSKIMIRKNSCSGPGGIWTHDLLIKSQPL